MNSLFASLKRSPRTRTRKDSTSVNTDAVCPPSRSSMVTGRKSRPPPLQIIPELSESEPVIDISFNDSPATARPTQSFPPQPKSNTSRVTLSAYTFSIDDALFTFGNDTPRSPALSASSSTSDGASSEDVPTTPRTSGDGDGFDFMLPTPRLCPKRISIHPLCITKTRSLVCREEVDIHNYFEKEEEKVIPLPVTEDQPEPLIEARAATEVAEETEQDFYTREFEDFISVSPVVTSPTRPARRDSLTLAAEASPAVIDPPELKRRGRSRHSKPLPLLPPATPPLSSLPSISTLPLVQTTAQNSIVRRKRNVPSLPDYSSPSPPPGSRPLPRVAIPLDIEDCLFPENNFDVPSRGPIAIEQVCDAEEDTSIYSRSPFAYTASATIHPLAPAIPETLLSGMRGEITLPRSSTDSDAPRSSIDSTSSFASSTSSDTPISPFSFPNSHSPEGPELESMQCLRSRWSSSTLASVAVESTRTSSLLSPFKSVLGSRARRVLLPPQKVLPQRPPHLTSSMLSKNKQGSPTTPLPLSTLGKHIRRQKSQSSTSSTGTSASESASRDGSPSRMKRKPIPVTMFLRAT